MAQKRKTNQSKLDAAKDLLRQIEEKTVRQVKGQLSNNWRDNLFEILMTRLELAAPHKKTFAALPDEFRQKPNAIPSFTKIFLKTMRNILILAKAPVSPLHVLAFSALYASVIKTFLDDTTRDRSKTMAALDQRLGWFEQFAETLPCPSSQR